MKNGSPNYFPDRKLILAPNGCTYHEGADRKVVCSCEEWDLIHGPHHDLDCPFHQYAKREIETDLEEE